MIAGMPTLLELDDLWCQAELCKKLGLQFIEINLNLPQYQLGKLSADELCRIKNQYQIDFTFHLPEDLDIAHFNPLVQKAHIETVWQALALMKTIGSKQATMHMSEGIYFTLPDRKVYLFEKYKDEYMNRVSNFTSMLFTRLEGTSIHFGIENTGIFNRTYVTEGVEELLKCRHVSLTWDIGHDASSGWRDREFIWAHHHRLTHFHLHNAIDTKNHLSLDRGDLDMEHWLQLVIDKNSTAVIETKTVEALTNSIRWLEKKGYKEGMSS